MSKKVSIMFANGYYPHMEEEEWREYLTPEQYRVLREAGTEPPFQGEFYQHQERGTYCCSACSQELFSSDGKFHSPTGWACFIEPISSSAVTYHMDFHLAYPRKEVRCSYCQSHLGLLFDDGPLPARKRFCINSISLSFTPSI